MEQFKCVVQETLEAQNCGGLSDQELDHDLVVDGRFGLGCSRHVYSFMLIQPRAGMLDWLENAQQMYSIEI